MLRSCAVRRFVFWGAIVCSPLVAFAERVELVVDEAIANRNVPWPVTTGVPFPRGALVEANRCRLVDDAGTERPLQTKVAATWDAARSSIRWLTIDFIAEPGRKYALEFGPEVSRQTFPPVIAIRDGDDVVVNTGAVEAEFVRRGPAALGVVRIDRNGDGRIAPEEKIAAGLQTGDRQFVDAAGIVSTSARDEADRTIVVESTGPVRACVRVDGWYTGPQGERIVAYRTRYHLFAGLPLVKLIDEFRIVGSTRDVQFADIALPLALNLNSAAQYVAVEDRDGASPPGILPANAVAVENVVQPLRFSVAQKNYRHYGNQECDVRFNEKRMPEDKAPPWLQLGDDQVAVTGSLRNFWQQFPKEWEANASRLTLHLWSPRAEPLDFGQEGLKRFFGPAGEKYLLNWQAAGSSTPISDFFYYAGQHALKTDGADGRGINKHHEVWYHFGRATEAAAGRLYGALADKQPICLATGAWNVGTDVFGPLAARPNDSPYEKIVDRIFDLERYAQDSFGDYGWFLFGAGPHYSYQWDAAEKRHYADPRRFEYHTYQRETQLWWCYLRSGERKFYDWCFPSENHWVDVAVAHVPTTYSTEWRGGVREAAKLHYRPGDWSIDSPLHYVRHHDTGEAWLRSAPQFWASYHRTLETTTLAYFLTGDERYNDVIQFWKEYWTPLAGVRSDSANVEPWHREQLWFTATKPGEPAKSWAEMLRDYAPFQSGSRHQQTLFFNLATLYEQTWDPTVRQVLDEYAAAFVRPENPNGVWQCQDHHLPANADSPMLAHYWSPALWKYARATGDPRMPDVLRKYFTAAIEADPYGGDVGIYSNNQIAWGWYFTHDPQYVVAARRELEDLLPNAEPLAKPEDLNRRIYNPYAPIKSLAAVPRLIAVLDDARRRGLAEPPPPPLEPQRTLTAISRVQGAELRGTLWGWDRRPALLDERGSPVGTIVNTTEQRSHRQPFDRALPGYAVYRSELTAAASDDRWIYLSPTVETGLLGLAGHGPIWCWAAEPVQVQPGERWHWRRPRDAATLVVETVQHRAIAAIHDGKPLEGKIGAYRVTWSLAELPPDAVVTLSTSGEQPLWLRIVDAPEADCWVTPTSPGDTPSPPLPEAIVAARRRKPVEAAASDAMPTFTTGRFGQAIVVAGKSELEIPDELPDASGTLHRLSDQRQGSIEFWIRRRWDERFSPLYKATILDAGSLSAVVPAKLPFDEWCHIAVDWFPLPDDPEQSLVCVYVDGVDYGNYRSMYWEGYGARPQIFDAKKPWLKRFLVRAVGAAAFDLDDLRISNRPRYVDVKLPFGRAQTFNPNRFTPPTEPAAIDDATMLKLDFDGDLKAIASGNRTAAAQIVDRGKK